MNATKVVSTLGAVLLASFVCPADDGSKAGPKPSKRPSAGVVDTNGDGKVSFEEAKAVFPSITEKKFKARDKDGDGYLSAEERVISDPRRKPDAVQASSRTRTPDPAQMFQKADKDEDGKVTWAEVQSIAPRFPEARFRAMDTNGDGSVGKDELRAARRKSTEPVGSGKDADVAQLARKADKDRDGKVSYEELQTVYPNLQRARFDELDRNNDGVLSIADRAEAERESKQGVDENLAKLLESDANSDGQVTFEELTTAKSGFPREAFDQADRNKDGVITTSDARAR